MKLLKITLVLVSLLVADTALALSGFAVKPSTPVQISPANGAVDQPLTITVAWRTSKPGESYRVQVATNAAFTSIIVNQGGITNATGYTLSGLPENTTLYWRVNASKSGKTSNWSPTWRFKTTSAPVIKPVTPTPILPANGAVDQNLIITVMWKDYREGESYRIQVATNAAFTSTIVDQSVVYATGYTLFLTKNTTFFWRVNASKGGQTSDWSPTWSFTTTNATVPPAPVPISPANGATGVPLTVTFVWNAVQGATAYDFQVSAEPTFNGTAHIQWYGHASTSIQPGPEALIEAYTDRQFWRVRGRNPAGYGAWSEVQRFTLDSTSPQLTAFSSGRVSSPDQLSETSQDLNESFLSQNYPNPFNRTTVIEFTVPKDRYATLKVLDGMGREVEKLFDGKGDGLRQQVVFDGERLSAGLYFYRLMMLDCRAITKRMVLGKE